MADGYALQALGRYRAAVCKGSSPPLATRDHPMTSSVKRGDEGRR
jgi:hypothetical protein